MSSLCTEPLRESAPALRALFRTRVRPFQALLRTLASWQARNESRNKLRRMPDYLLRDIGLGVDETLEETRKPFWQP
jgi:uncharacterized protein YjiS (DUF1127 family)